MSDTTTLPPAERVQVFDRQEWHAHISAKNTYIAPGSVCPRRPKCGALPMYAADDHLYFAENRAAAGGAAIRDRMTA